MKNRIFTPADAEKCLPLVRVIVRDILEVNARLKTLHIDKQDEKEEIFELQHQKNKLLEEVESLGCYFKEYTAEIGNIDFPSEINGNSVHLCWKSDEDHVLHYHKISESLEKRRQIPQKLLKHLLVEQNRPN